MTALAPRQSGMKALLCGPRKSIVFNARAEIQIRGFYYDGDAIYATVAGIAKIFIWNSDNTPRGSIDTTGEIDNPGALTKIGNYLYVGDRHVALGINMPFKIAKYNINGSHVSTITSFNNGTGTVTTRGVSMIRNDGTHIYVMTAATGGNATFPIIKFDGGSLSQLDYGVVEEAGETGASNSLGNVVAGNVYVHSQKSPGVSILRTWSASNFATRATVCTPPIQHNFFWYDGTYFYAANGGKIDLYNASGTLIDSHSAGARTMGLPQVSGGNLWYGDSGDDDRIWAVAKTSPFADVYELAVGVET